MKEIAYIIKTHNELPYLQSMLWSLKYNNPNMWQEANIYIFANRCNDGTKQWCDQNNLWCKEVDLPGLYSIWNQGASITSEPHLVFSASDFVLAPGFWNKIAAQTKDHPDFYHFTGTCIDNGISYEHQDEPLRRWYNRNCGDNWKEFDYNTFLEVIKEFENEPGIIANQTQYCPFITTRDHYNFLSGFNTGLGDYPTDIDHDFVRRGKELGRECCIVPGACFYHFGKKSLLRRDNLEYDWKEIPNI